MSRSSKDKGYRGEVEVAKLLASHGLTEAVRHPGSGAIDAFPGDCRLTGFCPEVKYQQRWDVPGWIRQAWAAARGGAIPVVIFRRNKSGNDPCGEWHVIEPAESWAARVAEVRELQEMIELEEAEVRELRAMIERDAA